MTSLCFSNILQTSHDRAIILTLFLHLPPQVSKNVHKLSLYLQDINFIQKLSTWESQTLRALGQQEKLSLDILIPAQYPIHCSIFQKSSVRHATFVWHLGSLKQCNKHRYKIMTQKSPSQIEIFNHFSCSHFPYLTELADSPFQQASFISSFRKITE